MSLNAATAEIVQLKSTVAELRGKLEVASAAGTELAGELKAASELLRVAKETNAGLAAGAKKLESKLAVSGKKLAAASSDSELLKAAIAGCNSATNELKNEFKEAERVFHRTVTEMDLAVNTSNNVRNSQRVVIVESKVEIARLEAQVEGLKARVEALTAEAAAEMQAATAQPNEGAVAGSAARESADGAQSVAGRDGADGTQQSAGTPEAAADAEPWPSPAPSTLAAEGTARVAAASGVAGEATAAPGATRDGGGGSECCAVQ